MKKEKTFEDNFPSLDKISTKYEKQCRVYLQKDIERCCLDKQKVRDAIIKFRDNIFETGEMSKEDRAKLTIKFDILNDELGL